MSAHTEQQILDLAADMKDYRIAAQNAAVAKGYDPAYFNTSTGKLEDMPDNLLKYFPGKKEAWGKNMFTVAGSNHKATVTIKNHLANATFSAVDNAVSVSPASINYDTAESDLTFTCASSHTLASAPQGFRLQIRQPDGGRMYIWVLDPV